MNPAPPPATGPLALTDFFAALRGEGFRLRPDDYVDIHRVLEAFRPQSPADVRALVAPLLVTSEEEQVKFDRLFAVFFGEISTPAPERSQTKRPRRPLPWAWLAAGLVVLAVAVYAAFFWPAPTFKTEVLMKIPLGGPYETGDTVRYEVDSSLRAAAGRQARWTWETPDGPPHPDEPEIAVVGRKPGDLVVKLTARSGRGLLLPNDWLETSTISSYPICARLPRVQLDSQRLASPAGVFRYRYTGRLTDPRQPVQATRWRVNSNIVARNQPQLNYTHRRNVAVSGYDVRFEALADTTQPFCLGAATLSGTIPGTNETPFTLTVRSAGAPIVPETRVKTPFRWAAWGLGGLVVALAGWAVWLVRQKKPEPPPTPEGENPLAEFQSSEPPHEIPFDNREAALITRDQAFHQVVRTFRQRTEEEVARLHIPRTLRATIHEGGFPTLVFLPRLAEVEFLFLIDHSQANSQQVALFEYLFRAFLRENVGIERFFFHQHFDRFTSETHPRGLTLRQLTDAHRHRRLVVWGNGHVLLNPAYPVVDSALRDPLAEFEHRAVLTPVPFADWGAKERALQEFFLLLPADLAGQVRLMQAFGEGQTRQDAYLRQVSEEFYRTEYVDFRDLDELREYLADEALMQWLGAAAVYPRLRWEVVVEMGRAVLPPEKVTFTHLLKLARIGWMHEGAFPDRVRLDLLKLLTPENEVKARETLLRMLDHAEKYFPGAHFFDEEKHLLQVTNRFTLFAHDAETYAGYEPAQREFRTLRERQLLPDRTTVRYLENGDKAWDTPLKELGNVQPIEPVYVYVAHTYHAGAEPLTALASRLSPLERQGLIKLWGSGEAESGSRLLEHRREDADLFLVLIDEEFLASDYSWNVELKHILDLCLADSKLKVRFIIMRDCSIGERILPVKISNSQNLAQLYDFQRNHDVYVKNFFQIIPIEGRFLDTESRFRILPISQGNYILFPIFPKWGDDDNSWRLIIDEVEALVSSIGNSRRVSRTSLDDYFDAVPPDEPAQPEPTPPPPLNPGLRRLLLALGFATLALVGTLLFLLTPRAREVDLAQSVPLTIALDGNACVTAANTSTTDYPRWTVRLNDSLVSLSNLRGTRVFSLAALQNSGSIGGGWGDETTASRVRNWVTTAFRPADDSLNLLVTLAVRDTGNAPMQFQPLALAGDTLNVSITSPDCFGEFFAAKSADSARTASTATRLRVDIFYSEENQASTQRIAQKLAQGLRSSNLYDVQVKLLRTKTNQQRYYLVSRNEIRFDAEEQPQAIQLKATAETLLRTEKITFATYGVSRPEPSKNYVSLFVFNSPQAGTPFVCQTMDPDWLAQFDGWEGPYSDYNYATPVLNIGPTRSGQYRLSIAQQATVNGRTNTVQDAEVGTSARLCQQNGVYLVQTSTTGSGRAMLLRNVTSRSCRLALVTLDAASLNGPQGQTYFDKLVRGASFSAYSPPSKSVPTANDTAQTAAPNDNQPANAPAQNAAPVWRRLGRVLFSQQAGEDWVSLNELARNNPNGRLRVVIYCDEKEYASYRDIATKALPAAANRIEFLNRPLDSKAQAYPRPYAEVDGSGITPPASAK